MIVRMLTIRAVALRDARAIADIYRPFVEKTTISFEIEPPDEREMQSRIERVVPEYPWLVAENGEIVGYAYAHRHRERAAYASSAEVAIYVREDSRRQGVGSSLYRALFAELAATGKFHRAFAGIALPNDASITLHKKLGFRFIGIYHEIGRKFGRWIDVAWWERGI
jgi:L-amino acid N-acyltransferase YncA